VVLGYLALLPFFLGVFFFLLLGLIPGAVLFRFGHPIRPLSSRRIWGAAVPVVLVTWLVAGYVESRALPGHVAVKVRNSISGGFPPGYSRAALERHVANWVGDYLRREYGSAGLLAYVRWAGSRGRIEIPQGNIVLSDSRGAADPTTVTLQLSRPAVHQLQQPALLWCVRVIGSLLMLMLSMTLQLSPLRKAEPPTTGADGPLAGAGR